MEFCGCADVILSGSLLDPADLGFAAANFRFPPLVSIDANGPKLMGWMAPASTGVAMRHSAVVKICL